MAKLTPKQIKFAQGIASGKSQLEAYQAAYGIGKASPVTVTNDAYKLMQRPDIIATVDAMRVPVIKKVQITLESHLARLEELSKMAQDVDQFPAAITAEVNRGKAAGLYTEKHQHSGGVQHIVEVSFGRGHKEQS